MGVNALGPVPGDVKSKLSVGSRCGVNENKKRKRSLEQKSKINEWIVTKHSKKKIKKKVRTRNKNNTDAATFSVRRNSKFETKLEKYWGGCRKTIRGASPGRLPVK